MGHRLLLAICLLTPFIGLSQRNLSHSRQTSLYTYIYKISTNEAWSLTRSNMSRFGEKHLHTLVDSFLTGATNNSTLPSGNYLFVHAEDNVLKAELKTVGDLQYELINNNRDLVVYLHNKQGQPITDARIFIGNRKIPFDANTTTYRLNNHRSGGRLKVYHNNVLHVFNFYNNRQKNIWLKSITRPVRKYVVYPIKKIWNQDRDYRYADYFNDQTSHEKKFKGFMVFNKPKYKPGDTCKLKAFILNRNGSPVNRPLRVRITDKDFTIDSTIAVIHPYRAGAFEYQFVLNDSLHLALDEDYLVTLEEAGSKKYIYDDYYGDLDEDEYALKRKVLMRGRLMYEEYELSVVDFTVRTDKTAHHCGDPLALYLKATDENELAIPDGRVDIVVQPYGYNTALFHAPAVFLPDTLWRYSQPLDVVGETKIIIPDSIFPAADFKYQISCTFLNSNNESHSDTKMVDFYSNPDEIFFEDRKDSLFISYRRAGNSIPANATVYGFNNNGDTLLQQRLQIPASIPFHSFAGSYKVITSSLEGFFNTKASGIVSCLASRTKDSVFIQVANPAKLHFWYTLFAGKKIIRRGYSDTLWYGEKVRTPKHYFVSLQYIYLGKAYTENYTVPFDKKRLNIQVNQPNVVYPGKNTQVDITVTDASGKPVNDVDVTAYAFTKKFEGVQAPNIPYLGKGYPLRRMNSPFYNRKQKEPETELILNWQRWSKEMGLDSIEYFKFLHPAAIYSNTEEAPGGITQIAPFVVVKGAVQPVHLVYIDEKPVFFSQAEQLKKYSFRISPGRHSLRLRTNKYMVKIDSVWAEAGKKTFFSIDAETDTNKLIHVEKMPYSLTKYEQSLWSRYMILIEDNFDANLAYIKHGEDLHILNHFGKSSYYRGRSILTGPFYDMSFLTVKNRFSQHFEPEGNYRYTITSGLIKQKQLPLKTYAFEPFLSSGDFNYDFSDYVLTEKEIDSLWQDLLDKRCADEDLFRNESLLSEGNGRLQIGIGNNLFNNTVFIKNIFLFRYDDPDYMRIYKGKARDLGFVEPGTYRLMLLLKNDNYFIKDSIRVQKDGINYYSTGSVIPHNKDNTSARIAAIINRQEKALYNSPNAADQDSIKEAFYIKYLDGQSITRTITGRIVDDKGMPMTGAVIKMKGTSLSTFSDGSGAFLLNVLQNGTLVVAYVGYETMEYRLSGIQHYQIRMTPATLNLNEVVVVGYGTAKRKMMTGSVSSINLQGSLPGILIRGSNTVKNSRPLVLLDGLPFNGDLDGISADSVAEVTAITGTNAVAIYGTRGADGVILITTKAAKATQSINGEQPGSGNALRKNFRDDAFWQPRLRTNAQGKVSFPVTWPDDITKWRSFFIAMGPHSQTGFTERAVRSFKLVSAALSLPQFAVAGDSINVIGKSLNYAFDSITVKRSFTINGQLQKEGMIGFRNAYIDTFKIVAPDRDSLQLSLAVQKDDGYFDGEERTIPVYQPGTLETHGLFAALEKDTSFQFSLNGSDQAVKIYAASSMVPVLLDEIEHLRNYEYLCNEQLASKLKALILKRKIYTYFKKDFKEEKDIRDIVNKLTERRSADYLWGWWKNTESTPWISLHVLEALLMAESEKVNINVYKQGIIDYCVFQYGKFDINSQLSVLHLLYTLQAKADFKGYIDSLERKRSSLDLYQTLRLVELKQKAGLPIVIDTLLKKMHHTALGNLYWGEDRFRFFDNAINNTIVMYRILKKAGGYDDHLQKIRNYFLEKRRDGKWRNTYESSLILETILPDVLQDEAKGIAGISINGGHSITSFPYNTQLSGIDTIHVSKTGDMPVYFTAYRQTWNKSPQKMDGNFSVSSAFERNDKPVQILKAGEPVTLKVRVSVQADADYVMVEIPIPAGCSYKDKSQSWQNGEVHREYFKNKVSLFCNTLKKGDYTFTVSLLPRYTGQFHLNPAKVEMMYFPVFNGREGMKKISIQ